MEMYSYLMQFMLLKESIGSRLSVLWIRPWFYQFRSYFLVYDAALRFQLNGRTFNGATWKIVCWFNLVRDWSIASGKLPLKLFIY